MRRVLFATISLLAIATTSAIAADIPRAMPPVKAPVTFAPMYNWTGFYVGLNGGYGWGRSDWSGSAGTANVDGGLLGGTIGYNWQAGSPWVFGLEGDIAWSDMRGSFTNALCPAGCETRNSWLGTARGRFGYAMGGVMPYVTGGLAVGDIRVSPVGFAGVNETNAGWTFGGGVEAAIAGRWTAKAEYLYVDLGSVSCGAAACGIPENVNFRSHVFRGGLNLRF